VTNAPQPHNGAKQLTRTQTAAERSPQEGKWIQHKNQGKKRREFLDLMVVGPFGVVANEQVAGVELAPPKTNTLVFFG